MADEALLLSPGCCRFFLENVLQTFFKRKILKKNSARLAYVRPFLTVGRRPAARRSMTASSKAPSTRGPSHYCLPDTALVRLRSGIHHSASCLASVTLHTLHSGRAPRGVPGDTWQVSRLPRLPFERSVHRLTFQLTEQSKVGPRTLETWRREEISFTGRAFVAFAASTGRAKEGANFKLGRFVLPSFLPGLVVPDEIGLLQSNQSLFSLGTRDAPLGFVSSFYVIGA